MYSKKKMGKKSFQKKIQIKTPSKKKEVLVIILAGGVGERFWPRSGKKHPKQLHKIHSSKTLLEETLLRARAITKNNHIFIACNSHLSKIILKTHKSIRPENFILEPEGRNTAPIIALVALILEKKYPHAIHVILSADHYISSLSSFIKNIKKAIESATSDQLITLGITPTRPETQYGYIEIKDIIHSNGAPLSPQKILSFKEKPDFITAKEYFQNGHFLWNSGIFIWKGKTILEEFEKHAPNILIPLKQMLEKKTLKTHFHKLPKTPIDIAILENSKRIMVVPANFQWDDLGSWNSLERVLPKDKNGNIFFAPLSQSSHFIELEARENIIASQRGLVALLGVEDMVVVQEGEILFIAHRKALDKIKVLLASIKANPSLQKYVN